MNLFPNIPKTTGQELELMPQPFFQSKGDQRIAFGHARHRHQHHDEKRQEAGNVFQLFHRFLQFGWGRVAVRRGKVQLPCAVPTEYVDHFCDVHTFHDKCPNGALGYANDFPKFHVARFCAKVGRFRPRKLHKRAIY